MEYKMLGCALRTRDKPFRGHKLEIRKDYLSNCINMVTKDYLVLVTPKSTSTQLKSTKGSSMDTKTMETQQLSKQKNSQTSSFLSEDFLAKLSALLEKEQDLTTPEVRSFLKSLAFSRTKNPDIWYSKTSKVYLVMTAAGLSRQSLGFSPTWGISLNGRYLTAKTSEFPKTESVSSLSDILEEDVEEKYFLSDTHTNRIMNQYRDTQLTPLPLGMKQLKPQERTLVKVNSMHKRSAG